jgi:hypothetical protein
MATQNDLRRIAVALPGAKARGPYAFAVRNGKKEKGFVWAWKERVSPKKARVPNVEVWAVRVADLNDKETLLDCDPKKFFTEPHYDGFPAVLVRLRTVRVKELRGLITAAWRCQAPRALKDQLEP